MKKYLIILLSFLFCSTLLAQPRGGAPPTRFQEKDGSPSLRARTIIVPNDVMSQDTGVSDRIELILISTASADSSYLRLDVSNDPLTAALDLPELYNSLGNLKIMPDVQGDVDFFGDTDVADGVDGESVYIHRMAAEGNQSLRLFVDDEKVPTITSGATYVKFGTNVDLDTHDLKTTGTLEASEVFNSAGDLKIMPDVQGHVILFGDTDVGDDSSGKALGIRRQAVEGDTTVNIYVDADMEGHIYSNTALNLDANVYTTSNIAIDSDLSTIGFGAAGPAMPDGTIEHTGSQLQVISDKITATDGLLLRGGTNGIAFNIGATEEFLLTATLADFKTNEIKTTGTLTAKAETEIFVASTSATTKEKALADYLCDGTNDEVQIQAAIDDLATSGGVVQLSSGLFIVHKPAGATDIVFEAELTDGAGQATLANLDFEIENGEGEAGDLAVGQLFRVSGGVDDDGGGESVEDNHSDCIVTLKQIDGGYIIDEDFNGHDYTTNPPTFVRMIGAIQLKGTVILRGVSIGGATKIRLANDQNCCVITKEDGTPSSRVFSGGLENLMIDGNRDDQGDHSTTTYHPECNGVVINADSWDMHFSQISVQYCKGDGMWFCEPWGVQVYGGGWIEFNNGSGIVFGDGTLGTINDIKIAEVGTATDRDEHESNRCPGDDAVFKVAGIRLHWAQQCRIAPSTVQCDEHWGIYALKSHGCIFSNTVFRVTTAGAAAEGSLYLHATARCVIDGCYFDFAAAAAGATGIKPGGDSNTISGCYFVDTIGGCTPIDWASASGMNNCKGNSNAGPYAVSIANGGTLLPKSPEVELTGTTGAGNTIGLSETTILENVPVTITNVGTNTCTFTEEAGVKELAGTFVMNQYDTLTVVYIGDRWVELSRVDGGITYSGGNITGADLDISAGTGDITTTGALTAGNTTNFGDGTATDVVLNFNTSTNDGIFRWERVGDNFLFSDDVVLSAGEKLGVGTTPTYLLDATGSHLGLRLHRNSATAGFSVWADWALENDASEVTTYGRVRSKIITNTDGSEDGQLSFYAMDGGTVTEQAYVDKDGFHAGYGQFDRLGCGTPAIAGSLVTLSHTNTNLFKATNTAASGQFAGAGFQFFSNDGAAVTAGDRLGFLTFGGTYDATNTDNAAAISSYVEGVGAWSNGDTPAGIYFETNNDGSSSRTTKMKITCDGDILLPIDSQKTYRGTGNDVYDEFDSSDWLFDISGATADDGEPDFVFKLNDAAGASYIFVTDSADNPIMTLSSDGLMTTESVYRTETSLYRRYYHLSLASFDPGASGAVWTSAGANTVGGWQLDNAGEELETKVDIHADWDGATDLTVEIRFQINAASAENNTVDIDVIFYYMGLTETGTKTQTITGSTNVGDGGAKAQFTMFSMDVVLPWDTGGAVVDAGDCIAMILNLNTVASEVDDIIINAVTYHYPITHAGIEVGDT